MRSGIFRDRVDAGRKLASALADMKDKKPIVLAIPRGGVVVASEVAKALGAPLDIVVTRKIGAPGEPEYALGAVTQEGEVIMNEQAAESIGAGQAYLDSEIARQKEEVKERMRKFRGMRPFPEIKGRVVVIVDDGIATGSSIEAAVMSTRRKDPKEIVVAVPVAPEDAVEALMEEVDRVVCLRTPYPFFAIGEFYSDFDQVEDDEVRRLLDENAGR